MAGQKRETNINFRVDPEDYDYIKRIAEEKGATISTLMRMLIKVRLKEVTRDGGFDPDQFIK